MNRNPSARARFNRQRITAATRVFAFAAALSCVPSPVSAQQGVLSFHGQIVNASCAASEARARTGPAQTVRVQVSPGVALDVSTAQNACEGQALPFSTAFTPLSSAAVGQGQVGTSQSAGVVTITYQ